jgi:hypothetical protein
MDGFDLAGAHARGVPTRYSPRTVDLGLLHRTLLM